LADALKAGLDRFVGDARLKIHEPVQNTRSEIVSALSHVREKPRPLALRILLQVPTCRHISAATAVRALLLGVCPLDFAVIE
jgi:hypothetical protein